jgi:GNAT superfamily N-acetyltransferase
MISMIEKEKPEYPHETLRFATLNDIPYLMTLASKLYAGSPLERFSYDAKKIRTTLEGFIIDDRTEKLCLVSHEKGKPVGVLAAYAFEPLFSKDKIAVEVFWYLDEEFRKGRRGTDMMKGYEHWAKLVGCKAVQYGWMKNSPEGMKALYERSGAKLEEYLYYKEI